MAAALRLLALLAMVMMPFGTAAAPAAPAERHHSSAASGAEHCADESSNKDLAGGPGGCAMPCSAALPATEAGPIDSPSFARSLVDAGRPPALAGLVLEIATPPPKFA